MHAEQRIIDRLRRLTPRQLDEVIHFIDAVVERNQKIAATPDSNGEDVKGYIKTLRGRGKGEHLLERLLQSRLEDRMRDERK